MWQSLLKALNTPMSAGMVATHNQPFSWWSVLVILALALVGVYVLAILPTRK